MPEYSPPAQTFSLRFERSSLLSWNVRCFLDVRSFHVRCRRDNGDYSDGRPHPTADMGGGCAALLLQMLMVNIILACLPREYIINNICCPMCDKGSFVKAHCTKELSSSVCVICADTTYMDHPNGLTECFRCKECDAGANLIVKETCTASSNTICECSAGHYCANPECDMCQEHKQCPPGEYVRKPGTPRTDTVCDPCPHDYFSAGNNSAECSPWTKCLELGRNLDEQGTSTTDSKCKEKRARFGYIAAFPIVSSVLGVIYFLKRDKRKEPEIYIEGDHCEAPYSKEETRMAVSETRCCPEAGLPQEVTFR